MHTTPTAFGKIPAVPSELSTIKRRQQSTWALGDYSVVGGTLQLVGEQLCESLDLRAGQRVLDVAAGSGNASLAAARRFCAVVASDFVPALLDRARERADAERLPMVFQIADAEALPFTNASFDVVMSTFGVMFTPDQDRAAGEMLRVCRPGGRIGLASWTPDSFIGELFALVSNHVPPPPGPRPAVEWGTPQRLAELLGNGTRIQTTTRTFNFRYRTPAHWLDVFRTTYGPLMNAFASLAPAAARALTEDVLALIARHDHGNGDGIVVPSTYLEAVILRDR